MSYEGYRQYICKNGHAFTRDAYNDDNPKCDICKAEPVWANSVDQTNGSWDDDGKRIDGYVRLQIDKPAKHKTCRACKHKEIVAHETYRIPKKRGHRIPTKD